MTRRDFIYRAATIPAIQNPLRASPAKNVIVAGAGLAGLCAAYELLQAGHRVTVLEARDRAGGRVFTLREPFSEDLYAEAGAEIFGSTHNLVHHYVDHFDLPLMPAPNSGKLPGLFYMNGRRIQDSRGGIEWPVNLPLTDQKTTWYALANKYIQPAVKEIGDPLSPGWPSREILEKYDSISTAEMLRRRDASPAAIAVLQLGYSDAWDNGTGPDSALCLLRDEALARGGRFQRIRGGNDRLPMAFARKLADRIHYRAALIAIEQDTKRITISVGEGGRRHKLSADYLICSIPFSVLRSIEITPRLSPGKQRAIRELSYVSVARVFAQSKTRFWNAAGFSGYAATDLPIGAAWDCSEGEPGTRGILECYTSGAAARHLASLTETQRVQSSVDNLEKLFPGMRANYEKAVSVIWESDPLARGAFAWFKVGQMSEILPHIASREGRVFFAGEHTSPWFGWMQGALESGRRAAREVSEA